MGIDIRKPLKNMLPHLKKAQEENLNEADTVRRVAKVLEDVLGYHGFDEITSIYVYGVGFMGSGLDNYQ